MRTADLSATAGILVIKLIPRDIIGTKTYKTLLDLFLLHFFFFLLLLHLSAAAAARTLSRTLFQSKNLSFSSSSSRFIPTTRNLSSKSDGGGGSLIEVNLETTDNENETVGLKRLEDAIYGIIVRRSAPDWLPFSPGSSYWVPPKKRPHGFAELIGKLTNPLSEDETLSLSNARGWFLSNFFLCRSGFSNSVKLVGAREEYIHTDDEM
ncbi:hypothetical protein MKW94_026304 [Papaver nudicaule]|uniref:Uncharacterized protein n=1 Tax=Papaver nudicaule TaxID=74823 RepID=A0AA41V347_PAPNU|nr:hypothetical protein [Papaver nudicaule]